MLTCFPYLELRLITAGARFSILSTVRQAGPADASVLLTDVFPESEARQAWAGWTEENVKNYRGPTPEGATLMAAKVGETLQATWTIGETGIAGPTGGKKLPPGYCCFAIVGPVAKAIDFNSGIDDREKNMVVFTRKALELLGEALDEAAPAAAKH